MSWVKRNLYFLVSSVLAIALLVLAGLYFYWNWKRNNDNLDKLNAAYVQLGELAKTSPNPGNDRVNNIQIALDQRAQALAMIERERQSFLPVPTVSNPTNNVVTKEDFASALRVTLDGLKNAASNASVTLPPNYSFSFEAEKALTIFAPGSLEPLSAQVGDIKTICGLLFKARINSLDNLRRERVSADDARGPQSDYLTSTSVTNQYAVLVPYEVAIHCFSTELAGVLGGFVSAPYGFAIKAINVEPGTVGNTGVDQGGNAFGAPPTPALAAPAALTSPPTARGGYPVILDEKQLKVTLVLEVIRLLPKK